MEGKKKKRDKKERKKRKNLRFFLICFGFFFFEIGVGELGVGKSALLSDLYFVPRDFYKSFTQIQWGGREGVEGEC